MFNSRNMKNILNGLNDKSATRIDRNLIRNMLSELLGKTLEGVTRELVDAVYNLIVKFDNMRFVEYKGSLYLIDSKDVNYLYALIDNNKFYLLENFLKLNNDTLEIRNSNKTVTYELGRPNHLSSYELKRTCYIETEMFYDEFEKEYYRVRKVNSYDDSYAKYCFVSNYKRLNDDQVLVSGDARIGQIDAFDEHDYTQNAFIVNYSGDSLDIDVNEYSHEIIGVGRKSKK